MLIFLVTIYLITFVLNFVGFILMERRVSRADPFKRPIMPSDILVATIIGLTGPLGTASLSLLAVCFTLERLLSKGFDALDALDDRWIARSARKGEGL